MRWLKSRQNPDGSFINLMSTIYVIPALIGALPYDLQEIRCPTNTTGRHCLQSVFPRENWDESRVLLFSPPTPLSSISHLFVYLLHLLSGLDPTEKADWLRPSHTPQGSSRDGFLTHMEDCGLLSSVFVKLSVANAENRNHLQIKLEIARILFLLWVWAHCNPFHR